MTSWRISTGRLRAPRPFRGAEAVAVAWTVAALLFVLVEHLGRAPISSGRNLGGPRRQPGGFEDGDAADVVGMKLANGADAGALSTSSRISLDFQGDPWAAPGRAAASRVSVPERFAAS